MKILHTSDWHLGQSFFTQTRKDEHQAFITWLLDLIDEQDIDAMIIAGDLFDTGTPPSYARTMYNQLVVQMQQRRCTLVVVAGNHDSVAMLNESRQLLACLNTHVIAGVGRDLTQQLISLPDRQGETGAILCAVPYLRPKDLLQSVSGQTGVEKRQALGEAIKQHYQQLFAQALQLRADDGLQVPIVGTGHLSALGVSQSDSVRDIYIGTLDGFVAEGFPPLDYIALGHIHKPQAVAGTEHIRYSGSPLALSFDELGSPKQAVVVEFEGARRTSITQIDIPVFQPMQLLKGKLIDLEHQLQQFRTNDQASTTWLCLEVTDTDHLPDLQTRVQKMVEGLDVDILQLRRIRSEQSAGMSQLQGETLSELTPEEVFARRLAIAETQGEQRHKKHERMKLRFAQILSDVQQGDQA